MTLEDISTYTKAGNVVMSNHGNWNCPDVIKIIGHRAEENCYSVMAYTSGSIECGENSKSDISYHKASLYLP